MLTKLDGYMTYFVMAALLAVVALEKGLGLTCPAWPSATTGCRSR